MQELVSASMIRTRDPKVWRVKIRFHGSYVEQDFDNRRIAWEYVLGWLPEELNEGDTLDA